MVSLVSDHDSMHETKSAISYIANTRKSTAIHDTHGQYNKMPKLSPAELSRMKAEKEGQEMARRKQHDEAMRQQAALQHAQRMGVQNLVSPFAFVTLPSCSPRWL